MVDNGPPEAIAPVRRRRRKWYLPSRGVIVAILLAAVAVCTWPAFRRVSQEPIHTAAEKGDMEQVRRILDRDPSSVNARTKLGWTPLYLAAMQGHKEVVAFLLDRGAEVDARNIHQETPLNKAAKFGHRDVVELLLAAGADVNSRDMNGCSPLHWAALYGHKGVIRALVANRADPRLKDLSGETPLEAVSRRVKGPYAREWREIERILREHDARKSGSSGDVVHDSKETAE